LNKAIPWLLAISVVGCGTGFESSAEINSLRVLGVQKDHPYAPPGSTVTLRMLWYDGKVPDGSRQIQRIWSPPCRNPAGDLYYACFGEFLKPGGGGAAGSPGDAGGAGGAAGNLGGAGGAGGAAPPALPANLELALPNMGDQWTVGIPKEIITERGTPPGGQVPYGLTYVFFGVCAGQMYIKGDIGSGFPVVCKDANGRYLGPDDFVIGYTSIYSYDTVSNANPAVNGLKLDGQLRQTAEEGVCVGAACTLPQLHPTEEEGSQIVRIPACADDGAEKCPAHRIEAGIPEFCTVANQTDPVPHCAETDQLAALQGSQLGEQMWVRYFAERGTIQSAVRLLNDAHSGWNPDFAGKWRAPKTKGPMFIWAVVQDSRGGEEWVRQTIFVE
jgi:hypothetical protein